jgi:hypothetical protein
MTLDDFLRYVLPDVSGCPSVTARQAVLEAAIDFLTFSGAWSEIQDPVAIMANIAEYDLEAPSGARCIDVKEVFTRAGALTPLTLRQLAVLMPNWQTAEANAPAYYTRAFDFTSIRVYPMPTDPNGETLSMHAVYTLKDDATTIPDEIVQRYRKVIAAGAKATLMGMSKVAWADPVNAARHQSEFDSGKVVARITANHDKTTGCVVVPARRFGQ